MNQRSLIKVCDDRHSMTAGTHRNIWYLLVASKLPGVACHLRNVFGVRISVEIDDLHPSTICCHPSFFLLKLTPAVSCQGVSTRFAKPSIGPLRSLVLARVEVIDACAVKA